MFSFYLFILYTLYNIVNIFNVVKKFIQLHNNDNKHFFWQTAFESCKINDIIIRNKETNIFFFVKAILWYLSLFMWYLSLFPVSLFPLQIPEVSSLDLLIFYSKTSPVASLLLLPCRAWRLPSGTLCDSVHWIMHRLSNFF